MKMKWSRLFFFHLILYSMMCFYLRCKGNRESSKPTRCVESYNTSNEKQQMGDACPALWPSICPPRWTGGHSLVFLDPLCWHTGVKAIPLKSHQTQWAYLKGSNYIISSLFLNHENQGHIKWQNGHKRNSHALDFSESFIRIIWEILTSYSTP